MKVTSIILASLIAATVSFSASACDASATNSVGSADTESLPVGYLSHLRSEINKDKG